MDLTHAAERGVLLRSEPRTCLEPHMSGDPSNLSTSRRGMGNGQGVCTVSSSDSDEAWDQYVLHHPDPHHEQLCGWSTARRTVGWLPVRVLMRVDGELVAGAQILERSIAKRVNIAYLNRGPLWSGGAPLELLIDQLQQLARQRRWLYLALSLPYQAYEVIPLLERAGFLRRPANLPPAVWARATTTINLTEAQDLIFSRFQATLRNRIRSGIKAGVGFAEGGRADLNTFWTLMCALCQRRGVRPNVPGLPFLQRLWDELLPLKAIRLFLATYRGEPVAGRILITLGSVARDWRVGSLDVPGPIHPTKVFYWDTIKWAKQQGFRVFDFYGIDYQDASELLAGRPPSVPFKCGITAFKCGFGGRIHLLPGEFCLFPNPLLRRCLAWGGQHVFGNRLITALASRLHQRTVGRGVPS